MSKLRVYKVAEQLGMDNRALVALFQSLGIDEVRNHMSTVSADQVERAKRHLSRGDDDKVVEERLRAGGGGAGVIIRRKKSGEAGEEPLSTPEPVPPVRRAVRAPAVGETPAAAKAPAPAVAPTTAPQTAATAPSVTQPSPEPSQAASNTSVAPSTTSVSAAPQNAPAAEPVVSEPSPPAQSASAPVSVALDTSPQVNAPKAEPEAAQVAIAEPAVASRAPEGPPVEAAEPSIKSSVNTTAAVAEPSAATTTQEAPSREAAAQEPAQETKAPASSADEPAPARVREVAAPAPQPTVSVVPEAARAEPGAGEAAPVSVPPVRRDPLHTDPIRRVGAPMGPAAAAAVRAAERARGGGPTSERSGTSQIPVEPRQQPRSARPAATDPARPAPKTGIDVWEGRPGVPMPQAPRNSGVPRRVQYDTRTGGQGASQGPRRPGGPVGNSPGGRGRTMSGPGGSQSRRPGGPMGMGSRRPNPNAIVTQERAAHKKVVRIEGDVSLQTLAAKMGVKAGEVLMKLMSLGVSGININSSLDPDTAKIVGEEFGWMIEDVAVSEDEAIAAAQGGEAEEVDEEREPRPPVVTVMGHVDHGKTSLLDRIRKSSVAQGEAGGITQHIGAYSVKTKKGRVTFLDTPGHAAFTQMRARGAKCTDIVVLVVAADDGVMPQTREAVNHAKDAKCPIVVAVNKVDKPDSQPERVRRELSDVGLIPEEWGGETLFCEVSAHSGQGIDELLDAILLQAEVLDLKANPKRHARGTVIEAKLDRGQGPVATVLVTEGTLRKGDGILVGNSWGKVRAMLDENGRSMAMAGPSTPVAVIGLNEVPSAGDMVDAVQDAKKAQQIAEQRRDKLAERSRSTTAKISLEELARRMNQSDQKELKLIIKGDVQGSVEALSEALTKLSTDKVRVTAVHAAVGAITEGDVNLAVAAKAIILGFNVRPAGKAATLAQKEGIEIRQYSVIYDATDDVLATMQGLLAPTLVEEAIGEAEVRKIFKVSKAGVVAGCMVTNGVVRRSSFVRLRRAKEIIWEGKIDSLKRFKDDAKEVREGFDCGISFNGFSELQEGDVISAFEMKEVRPTL